jgi:hypothetical protein
MKQKMNKTQLRSLILGTLLLFSLSDCKKSKQVNLEKLVENSEIPTEIVLVEAAKQIFGNEYKEAKLEEDSGYHVTIEFGGKTALTFLNEGKYEKELKLITALYAWKYFRYLEKRNLRVLVLSLVKPYYIHHEEINQEVIQDFEVFRIKISLSDLEKVPLWREESLDFKKADAETKERVSRILESITEVWTVELDEFKRVELK